MMRSPPGPQPGPAQPAKNKKNQPAGKRRAAFGADFAPPQGAGENLQKYHGDREHNPAQARNVETRYEIGKIDLTEREIKQRRRDQYFYRCKEDAAHVVRTRRVERGPGAGRSGAAPEFAALGMVLVAIWQ